MMNNIPGIEEVNMIRDDGHVIHFNNPRVQASLAANTFAITGHAETKLVTEILPQIINQLGPDSLRHLSFRLLIFFYLLGFIFSFFPRLLCQMLNKN